MPPFHGWEEDAIVKDDLFKHLNALYKKIKFKKFNFLIYIIIWNFKVKV
jgi:hypothetical protein